MVPLLQNLDTIEDHQMRSFFLKRRQSCPLRGLGALAESEAQQTQALDSFG